MSNTSNKITQDISKLVLRIRPNASQQLKQNIQDYCKKLLGSYSTRSTHQTPQQMRDKIIKKVSENSDSKTVGQCQETINKIMMSSSVQKKAEILKMLLKTSQLLSKGNNFTNMFNCQDKIQALNQTQQTMNNLTSITQISNVSNSTSMFTRQRRPMNQQQIVGMRNRGSIQQGISEGEILRQITYVMQNIEASFIRITPESDIYELQQNINVSQTVRSFVYELSEIGWLYKKIVSSLSPKGSIQKSLVLAVNEELIEYFRWLSIIQDQIKMGNLTLRKLCNWTYEPMQKLKWIRIILEESESYQGCMIISIINSFRPHGTKHINQLLNRFLGHLLQPLLQFVHNWMYKGELIDQHKEFFVEERLKVNQYLEWFQKYKLVDSNIPNILDKESAMMIFNAGKTIYFLKNRCKCNYSIPIPFIDSSEILNKDICESSNILSQSFKKWLTSVYEDLSAKLVSQLKDKFNLRYHLESMKHFYLMGKGDFIQHLVDTLKQQMMKPKHSIYQHTLDGYISDAMSKSFQDFRIDVKVGQTRQMQVQMQNKKGKVQESEKLSMVRGSSKVSVNNKKQINFDNSYRANIIDRLLAKKVDFAQTAWDSFNFQYSMDRIEPLYSILTPELTENYQRIFQFLWKIKRIEHILKQIWIIHQKEYPKTPMQKNIAQFSRILHRCHILRTNMSHFLNNFFGYLMIAIQSAWDKFEASVRKSQSLDEIIKQHRILHGQLSRITFSASNKKNLHQSLMNIFRSIQQFKTLQDKILTDYSDFYQKLRTYDNRKKIMGKGILSMEQEQLQIPYFDQAELSRRLMQINDVYNKAFKTFFQNLKKQGQQASVLVFRLDFSEYFAMKQVEETKMSM